MQIFPAILSSLVGTLAATAGGKIRYEFQTYQLEIDAAFGKSEYTIEAGGQFRVLSTDRDFIVKQSALSIGEGQFKPKPGHKITDLTSGEVYEVTPLGTDPCYRSPDQFGAMLRIHTKKIA